MHLACFWAWHCAVAPAGTRLSSLHRICDMLWQVPSATPATQHPAPNSAQQLRTSSATYCPTYFPADPASHFKSGFLLFRSRPALHFCLRSRVSRIPPCQPPFAPPCSQRPLPPSSLEGQPHRRLAPGSVRTPALWMRITIEGTVRQAGAHGFMDANYN